MQKNPWWKWLILAAAVIGSVAIVTPPFDETDADGMVVRPGKIKLGLDLRGGSSFIIEVDRDALRGRVREQNPDLPEDRVEEAILKQLVESRDVALEAIRNRIDGLGIAEPQIYPQVEDRIVIQMPGIDARKRDDARKSIQSVAFLEFRLVHRNNDAWIRRLAEDGKAPKGFIPEGSESDFYYVRDPRAVPDGAMDSAFWGELRRYMPREGAEFMLQRDETENGRIVWRPVYVERAVMLTGTSVDSAMVDYDSMSRPVVSLKLTRPGARRFTEVIRDYRPNGEMNRGSDEGRRLAVILDGMLRSAPEITDRFPHDTTIRSCEISGRGMDLREVRQLVNVLKTGALLAPMKIVQESTVDPTLGRVSIDSGVRAAIIGLVALAVFMLVYYMVLGLVANLALALNAVLLPLGMFVVAGILAVFARATGTPELPTLTLPGIAGIALMFGMAVDANVLIFERMREEWRAGKHLGAAIEAGYDRAFVTIVDSNLTTVLAAVIMFWQGSGPIRGYAVTLTAGILVSMYTAIVVTRMVFNALANSGRMKTLKMMRFVSDTAIDFLGKRKVFIGLSLLLLAGTWTAFVMKGEKNFGVDFVGGTAFMVEFTEHVPDNTVREALASAGVTGDAMVQYQDVGGQRRLSVQVRQEAGATAESVLSTQFSDAGFRVVQKEEIGAQIGSEMKRKGLMSLLWAMVGIVIYISIRFEFAFAAGAIVALLHDALLSIGIFCLLGRQITAPMIAVVLTIVGYSVNDTIVVFDRIREGLKLNRSKTYFEVANLAINQTLSRTLLTTGTTLLSVLALFIFGGGAINDFALLLLIGLVVGTYSSIFVATPVMLLWHTGNRPVSAPVAPVAKTGKAKRYARA